MKSGTSSNITFIQYQFCTICRQNHNKGRRHVYSKTHQQKVAEVVSRFRAKTAPIVRDQNTIVEDEYWENGKNFWCYFCEKEAPRHMKLEGGTIKDGGILEHLASGEHKEKTEIFWTLNKVPVEQKTQFLVDEEELKSFKIKAVEAVKRHEERTQHSINMERHRLQMMEYQCVSIVQEGEIQQNPPDQRMKTGKEVKPYRGKKTISARGAGLSSIQTEVDDDDDDVGNIHTGATPPWLLEDNAEPSTSREIGPSIKEYEKHLAREAKSKLPATRVGAKFDRNHPTTANWLPSFGQVWNHGRRLNTKESFLRREKVKNPTTARIPPPKRMKYRNINNNP